HRTLFQGQAPYYRYGAGVDQPALSAARASRCRREAGVGGTQGAADLFATADQGIGPGVENSPALLEYRGGAELGAAGTRHHPHADARNAVGEYRRGEAPGGVVTGTGYAARHQYADSFLDGARLQRDHRTRLLQQALHPADE